MKKRFVLYLLIIWHCCFVACKNATNDDTTNDDTTQEDTDKEATDDKLQVSVSFNAMYEFALAVGQDKVEINTIVPAGSEAHGFEPKAADIANLSDADVFVYNGLGMESWAARLLVRPKIRI